MPAFINYPFVAITKLEELNNSNSIVNLMFEYRTEYFTYKCLKQSRPGRYLFVLFHGAKDRNKVSPPYFDRWSWADVFPGTLLNVSDPTLDLSNELNLAWYCGNQSEWPIKVIADIASVIAQMEGKEYIVGYGSSNGGFAALAMQRFLNNGMSISINPQTNVNLYCKNKVSAMYKNCFNINELINTHAYQERLNVISQGDFSKSNKVVIVQNRLDEFHYNNHYVPFCNQFELPIEGGVGGDGGRFCSFLYQSEKGHGPESQDMVINLLAKGGIDS